jgi:hypothetical protein
MKKFVAFMCCTILAACTESVDLSSINKEATITNRNAEALTGIEPTGSYQWTKLSTTQPDLPPTYWYDIPAPYIIGGTVYVKAGDGWRYLFKLSDTKGRWEYISSGPLRDAFYECTNRGNYENYLFSYGSRFYYYYLDGTFYSASVTGGPRQTLTPFPGPWREAKMSFVIGTKGYVMGGKRLVNNEYQNVNDLWEYDFATDQWTYKGLARGGNRSYGKTAVLNGKLYVGMGHKINVNGDEEDRKDWLVIDFSNPSLQLSLAQFPPYIDYPGSHVYSSLGKPFVINNKIYLYDSRYANVSQNTHKLWEYNPATNKWSSLQDTPMDSDTSASNRYTFFSLGNAAYMINGALEELWRYSNTSLVPTNP